MIFLNCFKQILSDSFKEKRMVFEEPAPDASLPAPSAAPPAATPAALTPGPADTPEQIRNKLTARITALKDKVAKVTGDTDKDKKFTKKLVDAATALAGKIKEIEDQIAGLDLTATDVKAALDKFDTGLQAIEADSTTTSAFEDANLKADEALKTKVNEQREAITAKSAELTPDAIRNAVLADIGVEDPDLKAAIGEHIKDDDVKTAVDLELAAVTGLLDEAEGLTGAQADAKIEAAQAKLTELTVPKFVEPFADFTTEAKSWVNIVNALKALCDAGQLCLAKSSDVAKGVADMIKDNKITVTQKLIRDEFEEDIVLAHVGDVIGLTGDVEKAIEEIKGALRYYELGKYKKPYPNKKAEEILGKILEAKKATPDKLPGVKIDYLGGTDGTDHRLMKSKDWHSEKAAAFEKLKAFHTAGKLNGLTLTADQLKLIDEYIAAAKAGKGYEYVKDPAHKDAFLKGGGLFDSALALQRAEDMKKRIEGEDNAWKAEEVGAGTDTLHIETGTTKNKKEERKSGLKFSAIIPGVDEIPYQGDVDDALRQGAQNPDHTYEIEGQHIKVTFTNPETGEQQPAKYYAVAVPPEIEEFKMTIMSTPQQANQPADNYVVVEGKVNDTVYSGYFEFNPDKSFAFDPSNSVEGKPNLWTMYEAVADPGQEGGNGTITITKKEAAAGASEAPGAAPAEDPDKADKERAALLEIPFKTKEEAKAEGNLTENDTLKAGFHYADPVADSQNYAAVPNSTPKIAADKFQQILPDNLKGKNFFFDNDTGISRDKQGDNQVYSLYSDGHLETTKEVSGTEQTFVLAPGKDPDVETNWEVKQAPATKEQTNEKDHAYHIEPDGRLKVTFKGEITPNYYEIVKPDNVTLEPIGGDYQDVRFGIGEDVVWFEFDDNKKFDPGNLDDENNKYTYTAKLEGDTITITATPKSATTPNAPGQLAGGPAAAPDALAPLRAADEQATRELNTTLDTAFTSVNAKITELETTIQANEGWKTGLVQQTIDEKRKVMNETVIYTRAELEKSKKAVGEGKYAEAIDILATLASTLDTKLQEQLQADSRENFLSDASKAKITALRGEVNTQKDLAAAAFAKKKAAFEALDQASSKP